MFKFPSTWRPLSYQIKSCAEQADFFTRMQSEPDFLERELTQLALAQELLKPHTRVAPRRPEADLTPGAVVEGFRQVRGLTNMPPAEGPPTHLPSPALRKFIQDAATEEIQRQQRSRFAELHLFYAEAGRYSGARFTRALVHLGRWTRVRIELEFPSAGASLRLDPCQQPALIQIAWLALRRGPAIVGTPGIAVGWRAHRRRPGPPSGRPYP